MCLYLVDNVKEYQNVVVPHFRFFKRKPNKRLVDGPKVNEHYAIIPTKNIRSVKTLQGWSKEERT